MYSSATLSDYSDLIEAEADLSKAFSLFTSVKSLVRSMSKTWFTKHNATHRDVNTSYQCHSCPKKFKRKEDMKKHSFIHTNERPHKCTACDAKFKRRHHLENHLKTIHSLVASDDQK